jgi:hypothetical protein
MRSGKPTLYSSTRRLPPSTCPRCQTVLDACTGIGDEKVVVPCDGDLTFCLCCGLLLEFCGGAQLREANPARRDEIDPQLLGIVDEVLRKYQENRDAE